MSDEPPGESESAPERPHSTDPSTAVNSVEVDGRSVSVAELDRLWTHSRDEPLEFFAGDDPQVETGTYVLAPGERVPESGTTSHGGDEISVVLSGTAILGLPGREESLEATAGTLSVIPAGVEHYSHNPGPDPVKLVYTVVGEL